MAEETTLQDEIEAVSRLASTSRILDAVCATTGIGFAAIARVTTDRWIACAALDRLDIELKAGDELDAESTLCLEVQGCGEPIVIDDVRSDPLYHDHPAPQRFGFRSYISVPIFDRDGAFFGTLCGFDPEPGKLTAPAVLDTFVLFAELVAAQLNAHQDLANQGRELKAEQAFGRLREEFLAVLGHDLRNPVTAIMAGARMLGRAPLDERQAEIVRQIGASASRMDGMIGDLLDLARGRLGGGIPVNPQPEPALRDEFELVVAEIRATTGRDIECRFDFGTIRCDRSRMGQLLSNLVGNAVTHGDPEQPVCVEAVEEDGIFKLSVTNSGRLPARVRRTLFRPFQRNPYGSGRQGLGLGLYIASEIAKAHGGDLTVRSTGETVTFTMKMQVDIAPSQFADAVLPA